MDVSAKAMQHHPEPAADWDIFLSHASEDKLAVVEPLADGLRRAGLRVWVDSQELRLGDSLRRKIEEGLLKSRFGVVVLSPSFFRKRWPQRELEAILALETHHGKRLLPVIHEMDFATLIETAPLLADKVGVSTSDGITVVTNEILRAIGYEVREDTTSPQTLEHPDTLIGTTVGGYRLEQHLGGGGSGVVFVASHSQQRSPFAIKIFFPLRKGYRHLIGLFERGFRAVSAVRHPNVIAVTDHGQVSVDGTRTVFMVTELVDGSRLDEWASNPTNSEQTYLAKLRVASSLGGALAACHAASYVDELGFQVRGVLHGDIKPANVLVDRSGEPRLLDFLQVDVQRLIDPRIVAPDILNSTPITAALGTPGFMAPEQERHGIITEATDIFGLGITLAHLFATHDSPNVIMGLMRSESVSGELRSMILKMISRDPSERPASMAAVHSFLEGAHQLEKARLQGLETGRAPDAHS